MEKDSEDNRSKEGGSNILKLEFAEPITSNGHNQFIIARSHLKGLIQQEENNLSFGDMSKVVALIWGKRTEKMDKYYRYLASKDDEKNSLVLDKLLKTQSTSITSSDKIENFYTTTAKEMSVSVLGGGSHLNIHGNTRVTLSSNNVYSDHGVFKFEGTCTPVHGTKRIHGDALAFKAENKEKLISRGYRLGRVRFLDNRKSMKREGSYTTRARVEKVRREVLYELSGERGTNFVSLTQESKVEDIFRDETNSKKSG